MSKQSTADRDAARAQLRKMVKPGDTVYAKVTHVARSGMMRTVDLYVMQDNQPIRITWNACRATGRTYNRRHEAMQIEGCGTDARFEAVHDLSWALFPDGFTCIGKGCPAADHSNGDRDYTPHQHDRFQGAYALQWRSL